MKIEYCSNNSGGDWWLSDDDWKTLEKNGWKVDWIKDRPGAFGSSDRWLGALAMRATKDFPSCSDAEKEFEELTGQDPYTQGCVCCGEPHNFTRVLE